MYKVSSALTKFSQMAVLLLITAFALLPFGWSISTAFKTKAETFALPTYWIPKMPTFEAFVSMWQGQPVAQMLNNSLIVSISTTLITVIVASLAAYGLSRFPFKGDGTFLRMILIAQMFPGVLLILPYFIVFRKLGLINTHLALILAHTSFTVPMAAWFLRGYFQAVNKELDEAAMTDGCNRLQAILYVILPVAMPGLSSVTILVFISSWSEYLFGLVLMTDRKMHILTVGLGNLLQQYGIEWNQLMAMGIISIIPLVIIFLFLDRYLVVGLTSGAVKG